MRPGYLIRNLHLVERNRRWLASPLPARERVRYYGDIASAYGRLLRRRERRVRYLGRPFCFDNPATPLNLQTYPDEVQRMVLAHLPAPPRTVLDIGANLGQFACTLAHLVPGVAIDAFEPNETVLPLLRANVPEGVVVHPHAVGPAGPARFFHEPGRSGVGSFVRENAGFQERVVETEVSVVGDVAAQTGRDAYDLVKVDVEGAELAVVEALAGLDAGALFIEASGAGRCHGYRDSELLAAVERRLGPFDIAHVEGGGAAPTIELLLRFG